MQMPELLKRPKLGCREPVTECRVFTEEGPLLVRFGWHPAFTASSPQSPGVMSLKGSRKELFKGPYKGINFLLSSQAFPCVLSEHEPRGCRPPPTWPTFPKGSRRVSLPLVRDILCQLDARPASVESRLRSLFAVALYAPWRRRSSEAPRAVKGRLPTPSWPSNPPVTCRRSAVSL